MAIGETLLKITDYPFTYSIAFLLMRLNEVEFFSIEATPYLLGAGFGATVFAIVDPIGRGVKEYIKLVVKSNFRKKRQTEIILHSWDDVKGAFHTRVLSLKNPKYIAKVATKREYAQLVMLSLRRNEVSDSF